MGAKNQVIAGDYKEYVVCNGASSNELNLYLIGKGEAIINKETLLKYELVDSESVKSGTSAILRGAVGVALLGGVGLLAGLSAKNKGIYTVALEFKDGKKSLVEMSEKRFKKLQSIMF